MKILAITSCPNGIAHTYMAQEKLEQTAQAMGVEIKVETQGGVGAENVLTEKDIREAEGIIIAADRKVDLSRFDGKQLIVESVREAIHHPEALIQRIMDHQGQRYQHESEGETTYDTSSSQRGMQNIYQHLMNGVSFMVPFIVVGGLLIAIALTLGGETSSKGLVVQDGTFWKSIERIGQLGFQFMVPILAGYIAYSIADKPGLVPGMIGGAIAADGSFYGSDVGAGFLGGIIAGFIAGYIAKWIKNVRVPKAMAPIMPIIVIPIIASVLVGLIFIYVIGAPISNIFAGLTAWLKGMQGTNSIILAMIIGAMIAFDMGGPVNKVAFLFGSALIAEGNIAIMGIVAVAVCTPPLGLGLATFVNRRKFNTNEREMGKASFTMGLFGITEGAIPFATQDPLRIIPANVLGAMAAAVVAAIGGVGDRVAHGGPIVAALGGIEHVLMFILAIIVGSVVTMLCVLIFKPAHPVAVASDDATAIQHVATEDDTSEKNVTHTNTQHDDIFEPQLIEIIEEHIDRDTAIDALIQRLAGAGYVSDVAQLKADILEREAASTTAIGMSIAIPHAKSAAINIPKVAVLKHPTGVAWESLDGTKPQLVFLIAVPNDDNDTHLKLLQRLSKRLMHDTVRQQLIDAKTTAEIYTQLQQI